MPAPATITLPVSRARAVGLMLSIDVTLFLVHVLTQSIAERRGQFEGADLLDMDAEVSVPTWWAQSKLLIGAVFALLIGGLLRRLTHADHRHWMALGLIFLFTSIDEGSEIHERFIEPLRDLFGVSGGIFWFAWLIPGITLLALFGVAFLRFWLRTPMLVRRWLAASGVIFLGGAVVLEMVGGSYESDRGQDLTYSLMTGAEELLELVGTSVFIGACLAMILHVAEAHPFAAEVADGDAVATTQAVST